MTRKFIDWPGQLITDYEPSTGLPELYERLVKGETRPLVILVNSKDPATAVAPAGYRVVGMSNQYGNARGAVDYFVGRERDEWPSLIRTDRPKETERVGLKLWDSPTLPARMELKSNTSKTLAGKTLVRNWVSGTPDFEILIESEGKVVAVTGWKTDQINAFRGDKVYLLYCFASPACKARSLPKFVLDSCLSREMQKTVGIRQGNSLAMSNRVSSTCFSKNPVSMPYRGIFELEKREKADGEFKLKYVAPWSGRTLKQICAEWRQKEAKHGV